MKDACPRCGKSLALVGRVHKCVPNVLATGGPIQGITRAGLEEMKGGLASGWRTGAGRPGPKIVAPGGSVLETVDAEALAELRSTKGEKVAKKAGGKSKGAGGPKKVQDDPGGDFMVRGVSGELLERLEATRKKLGLRSRNETVVYLLEKGAEK